MSDQPLLGAMIAALLLWDIVLTVGLLALSAALGKIRAQGEKE